MLKKFVNNEIKLIHVWNQKENRELKDEKCSHWHWHFVDSIVHLISISKITLSLQNFGKRFPEMS